MKTAASRRILLSRNGATSIEYGLMVALIAVAILGALTTFSEEGTGLFNSSSDKIVTAIAG